MKGGEGGRWRMIFSFIIRMREKGVERNRRDKKIKKDKKSRDKNSLQKRQKEKEKQMSMNGYQR